MRLGDGREALVRLELPLSVTLVAEMALAIDQVACEHGYTDVVFLTDGTSRIVATPPEPTTRTAT